MDRQTFLNTSQQDYDYLSAKITDFQTKAVEDELSRSSVYVRLSAYADLATLLQHRAALGFALVNESTGPVSATCRCNTPPDTKSGSSEKRVVYADCVEDPAPSSPTCVGMFDHQIANETVPSEAQFSPDPAIKKVDSETKSDTVSAKKTK